eukprot:1169644-Amphidinium_carterae.1
MQHVIFLFASVYKITPSGLEPRTLYGAGSGHIIHNRAKEQTNPQEDMSSSSSAWHGSKHPMIAGTLLAIWE